MYIIHHDPGRVRVAEVSCAKLASFWRWTVFVLQKVFHRRALSWMNKRLRWAKATTISVLRGFEGAKLLPRKANYGKLQGHLIGRVGCVNHRSQNQVDDPNRDQWIRRACQAEELGDQRENQDKLRAEMGSETNSMWPGFFAWALQLAVLECCKSSRIRECKHARALHCIFRIGQIADSWTTHHLQLLWAFGGLGSWTGWFLRS